MGQQGEQGISNRREGGHERPEKRGQGGGWWTKEGPYRSGRSLAFWHSYVLDRRFGAGAVKRYFPIGLILVLSIAVFSATAIYAVQDGKEREEDLCRNQHSIVVMQELFLQEHENLRQDLREAGIRSHEDPALLQELEQLIEAADCEPRE